MRLSNEYQTAFFLMSPQNSDPGVAMTNISKVRFKELISQQVVIFPANIGDRMPGSYPLYVVVQVVKNLNIDDVQSGHQFVPSPHDA